MSQCTKLTTSYFVHFLFLLLCLQLTLVQKRERKKERKKEETLVLPTVMLVSIPAFFAVSPHTCMGMLKNGS